MWVCISGRPTGPNVWSFLLPDIHGGHWSLGAPPILIHTHVLVHVNSNLFGAADAGADGDVAGGVREGEGERERVRGVGNAKHGCF